MVWLTGHSDPCQGPEIEEEGCYLTSCDSYYQGILWCMHVQRVGPIAGQGCQIFLGTIYQSGENIYIPIAYKFTKCPLNSKWPEYLYPIVGRYQHFPFQDPPKYTQIEILGLKRNHLATLFFTFWWLHTCWVIFWLFGFQLLQNREKHDWWDNVISWNCQKLFLFCCDKLQKFKNFNFMKCKVMGLIGWVKINQKFRSVPTSRASF
jgi:hypothetical protein